jgi:hypothetical protein
MNPTMPPPVPACHGFALMVETGAASASMKKESCKSAAMTKLNMLAVSIGVVWETESVLLAGRRGERRRDWWLLPGFVIEAGPGAATV